MRSLFVSVPIAGALVLGVLGSTGAAATQPSQPNQLVVSGGLLFFDAGQVWEGLGSFETDLAKSLGLGLRARTPVGLLRFDLAFPLDRRPEDEEYKLYFGFGNAF